MPIKLVKEFQEFAIKGNVVDMAVGIMIGGAFGTIVKSLVNDILMPPIGLITGGMDFRDLFFTLREGVEVGGPYVSMAAAQEAGAVTLNYGLFINSVLSFLILAWAVFLVVRAMNRLRRDKPPAPEPAPVETPPEEILLTEIRDLLKAKS